ncbi:MAG TPA: SGNH/GDSL hydrolase family protein [Candidatus Saccharimonadales bacterium]|nr:SGNH/GDSL hydrolase family protein [Candidatus Saccharimonadales bacterium]
MQTVLIFLGILLVGYIIVQFFYTSHYFSVGSKLTKTTYARKTTLGSSNNPTFKLWIAGDSVGAGVGASSFENSVAGRLGEYFAKDHQVIFENVSVSGNKVEDVVSGPSPSEKQDLIVLIVSSNNLFRFTSMKDFASNVPKLFTKFSPLADKVILIGPGRISNSTAIPLPMRPLYVLEGPKYAKILKSEAAKFNNVVYVDPLEHPLEDNKFGNIEAADHFHPNDSGHKYWFDLIVESLSK